MIENHMVDGSTDRDHRDDGNALKGALFALAISAPVWIALIAVIIHWVSQ